MVSFATSETPPLRNPPRRQLWERRLRQADPECVEGADSRCGRPATPARFGQSTGLPRALANGLLL